MMGFIKKRNLEDMVSPKGQLTKLEKTIKSMVNNEINLSVFDKLGAFLAIMCDFQKENWDNLIKIKDSLKDDNNAAFVQISAITSVIRKSGRPMYKTELEKQFKQGDVGVTAIKNESISGVNVEISTHLNLDGYPLKINYITSLSDAEDPVLSGIFAESGRIAEEFFQQNSTILLKEISKLREILKN